MKDEVSAAIIIIGSEVLSGRTQDVNVRYIALGLNDVGVRLREVRVIPDDEAMIVDTVNELRARYAYVFTTGGIGPTHDDITAESLAKAFGVPLLRNPEAVARLSRVIKPENMNEARLRMANIPEGGELVDNPISYAPGFRMENVYVLAGVPKIMQAMFDGLKAGLKGGLPMASKTITLFTTEGAIADDLRSLQNRRPETEIGSYPFSKEGLIGTKIVVRGTDVAIVAAAAAEVVEQAKAACIHWQEEEGEVEISAD